MNERCTLCEPLLAGHDIHTSPNRFAVGLRSDSLSWCDSFWEGGTMELTLGRFADTRLEQGDAFCTLVWWLMVARG